MSYKIVDMRVPKSKYAIKCPHVMSPNYVVIHNTANTASARNEVQYMRTNNNYTSYHVAVDDKEVVQAIPFNRNAWHTGDGSGINSGNRKAIGIEICYSMDNGYSGAYSKRHRQAEDNAALYAAHVLKQYGWGTERLRQHYDYTRKDCPHKMRAHGGWSKFVNKVQGHLEELNGKKKVTAPPKPASGSSYKVKSGDSLWAIAKANNTTVAKLKSLNGLKSNTIKVGQTLKVSGTPAKKFDKYKDRGRSTKAHFSGTIDSLGAEVRKRRGSRSSGFNWNQKAGYSLKPGSKVYIFEVHDGWARIYTGRRTGKGSNEWVYLDRVNV